MTESRPDIDPNSEVLEAILHHGRQRSQLVPELDLSESQEAEGGYPYGIYEDLRWRRRTSPEPDYGHVTESTSAAPSVRSVPYVANTYTYDGPNTEELREGLMRQVADVIVGNTPETRGMTPQQRIALISTMGPFKPAEETSIRNAISQRYGVMSTGRPHAQLESARSQTNLPARLGGAVAKSDIQVRDPGTGEVVTLQGVNLVDSSKNGGTIRPTATPAQEGYDNGGDPKEKRKPAKNVTVKFAGACAVAVMGGALVFPPAAQWCADSWPAVIQVLKFGTDPVHAFVTGIIPEPVRSVLKAARVL